MEALEMLAGGLRDVAARDARAILRPGEPYAVPRTRERWIELLDMDIHDLTRLRTYFERETPDQVSG